MGTISTTLPVAGGDINAGPLATDITTITNVINGNLDNANISASAAIAQSKLAFDAWQIYTPVWGSSGTQPVVNNGTSAGRYSQVGKTVNCQIKLTLGSTSTVGTGAYTFSLPVPANVNCTGPKGTGLYTDASAAQQYVAIALMFSTTALSVYPTQAAATPVGAAWGAATPVVPATSDVLEITVTYEAA